MAAGEAEFQRLLRANLATVVLRKNSAVMALAIPGYAIGYTIMSAG